MDSLRRLGIERFFYAKTPEKIIYSVTVPQERLKDPKSSQECFDRIILAIAQDASRREGLDNLAICAKNGYLEALIDSASRLHENATEQQRQSSETARMVIKGSMLAGGAVGLIFGYDQMTKLASNVADKMNSFSYLIAPLTGAVETGISLFGTALTTGVGGVAGSYIAIVCSKTYNALRRPLAKKDRNILKVKQALLRTSKGE